MFRNTACSTFLCLLSCLLVKQTAKSCVLNPRVPLTFSETCTAFEENVSVTMNADEIQRAVSCRINCTTDLIGIVFPPKILSLFLSHNSLPSVQNGCFHNLTLLQNLYLDHNKITHIDEEAFSHLNYLVHLDLSNNLLKTWINPLRNNLPALQSLNLAHNVDYIIAKDQFTSTNCSTISGVNLSPYCKGCNFTRVKNVTGAMIIKRLLSPFIRNCIYFPKESNSLLEEVRKSYVTFNGTCTSQDKECSLSELTSIAPLYKRLRDVCYPRTRKLRPIVYTLGIIALSLNLVVLTSILSIKKLRRLVPFVLVAHLSFCDMLMGIYAIGTAVGHEVSPDFQEMEVYRTDNTKCPVFWVLFLLGQTLGVCTCVLVTIERYLATVYCMKPTLKLEMRTTMYILPGFWIIAIIIAFPLQIIDFKKITLNFMCVLLRDYSAKRGVLVSQGLMIAYLMLYIIIVLMYCRIYISVRNSSRRVMVNIKREARLARRIGVIVMTNFVCFALPNLSMLVFTTTQMYISLDDISNTIIRRWLPPMVLVLNACANPFFFAYGNEKFSTSLKTSFRSFLIEYLGLGDLVNRNPRVAPSVEMKTLTTAATSSKTS